MHDVLDELKSLPEGARIILRSVVGSTVHGTSVEGTDDRDEMAIAVEPKDYVIGLKRWETSVYRTQPEGMRSGPGDLDLVVHGLRKYARLASRGNPTIILLLFAPAKILDASGFGLLANRDIFISKQAGKAFQGYMHAQLSRLTGEAGGHGVRQELVDAYGFDTKYAGHVIRLGYQGIELMETGMLSLPMLPKERQDVVDIRTGKWTKEQVIEKARDLQESLRASMFRSNVPENPDYESIDKLLINIYERTWEELK